MQSVLREIKPSSTNEALQLINEATSFYTRIIAAQLGSNAALEVLRRVESLAPLDALLQDKKEGDLAANVVANLAATRADLLSNLGRTEEARRVLRDARSKIRRPMDIAILDRAASKLEPAAPAKGPKEPTLK